MRINVSLVPGDGQPFIIGHEAAGIVMEVGEGVTHVKPGEVMASFFISFFWFEYN